MTEKADQTDNPQVTRLFVAIHGIGDQYRYATIQSVARQVTRYAGHAMGWPLGAFHLKSNMTEGKPYLAPPPLGDLLFGEIFWADIHRRAAALEDTIEEEKSWAQTIVERLRSIDEGTPRQLPKYSAIEKIRNVCSMSEMNEWRGQYSDNRVDYRKTAVVLDEIIASLATIENLNSLAAKEKWFEFDLNTILTDFIGTVQIVADFKDYRTEIMQRFDRIMTGLMSDPLKNYEVHIVAHSEGTVVALKVLMEAFSVSNAGPSYRWASKVKSLMTIGSPLNKHIVMWPELWNGIKPSANTGLRNPILWHNYYDYGDPVGFNLQITRDWLRDNFWLHTSENLGVFKFPEERDFGFTRYPLPGAAHNGYWSDADLFDHYIKYLVLAKADDKESPPPKLPTRAIPAIISWFFPFLVSIAILAAGVYILYTAVNQAVDPGEGKWDLAWSISAITSLLAAVTVLSRIPRLVKNAWWYLVAVCIFAIGAFGYCYFMGKVSSSPLGANTLISGTFAPLGGTSSWLIVAAVIGVLSFCITEVWPELGMLPLVGCGTIAACMVMIHAMQVSNASPTLWAILAATAAFFLLWKLAASLFDLSFIWHRYIRGDAGTKTLRSIRNDGK